MKIWKLNKEEGFAYFDEEKGIKIPLKPFAGEMGVARKEKGPFSTIPPYATGGNIDTRHVTAGVCNLRSETRMAFPEIIIGLGNIISAGSSRGGSFFCGSTHLIMDLEVDLD